MAESTFAMRDARLFRMRLMRWWEIIF